MSVPFANKNLRDWDPGATKGVDAMEDAGLNNTTSADVNSNGENPQKEYTTGSGKPSGPLGMHGRE